MKTLKNYIIPESSNRRGNINKQLTKLVNDIYDDDNEIVIGDETVATMLDDGTIVFPKGFNKELAKFIVVCYIYKHSDWEVTEEDYNIYIGDPNHNGEPVAW